MIDILILLLRPALLWESDPKRYWFLTPLALLAWLADMAAAHSAWALVAGWPHPHEWTISHTLERLCWDVSNPDRSLYCEIAKKINRLSPGGRHIKAVV